MRWNEINEATPIKKRLIKRVVPASNVEAYFPIAKQLIKDCGPYLTMIQNSPHRFPLYHGLGVYKPGLVKMECPLNRVSRDTDPQIHEIADNWFFEQFRIHYRSNAFFGTGSRDQAHGYGYVYALFPIGQFNFCYSPEYADLTDVAGDPLHNNEDFDDDPELKPRDEWDGDDYLAATTDLVEHILRDGHYQNNTGAIGLQKGIWSKHEIMINNKAGGYLFSVDEESAPTLLFIERAIQQLVKGVK